MDSVTDLLDNYKRHPFAEGLLPFKPTLDSLETPYPKIYAKQDGRQRWVIYDKSTGRPAMFSHAGVISQCDHIESGNFVPDGQEIPKGLELKNVQRRANTKCFYTYIMDTYVDLSLFEGQWILDDYIKNVKGFNPRELPRRAYLSGLDPKYKNRFWMQTPMFLQMGPNEVQPPVPRHLHPWVARGHWEAKVFRANPDRPRVWVKEEEKITPISDGDPDTLQRGDVVAVSFTITYHITASNWFPQVHPADIVVLKRSDGDPTDYSAPEIDLYSRPPLSFTLNDSGSANKGVEGTSAQTSPVEDLVYDRVKVTGDVVQGGIVGKSGDETGEHPQESTELDGTGLERERSTETLASNSDGMKEVGEGGRGDGAMIEGFVDVMADEDGRPATCAGSRKASRSSRKRQ